MTVPPFMLAMDPTKEIDIPTYDGLKLRGTLYSVGEKKPCVIMSSGVSLHRGRLALKRLLLIWSTSLVRWSPSPFPS